MENSVIYAIGLLIAKEIVSAIAQYFKTKNQTEKDLQIAVNSLNHEVKRLNEKMDEIVRIKADVDKLWSKFRGSPPPLV